MSALFVDREVNLFDQSLSGTANVDHEDRAVLDREKGSVGIALSRAEDDLPNRHRMVFTFRCERASLRIIRQ